MDLGGDTVGLLFSSLSLLQDSSLLLFCTLVTGPRRSLSIKLSDTRVYEPQIRACLGTRTGAMDLGGDTVGLFGVSTKGQTLLLYLSTLDTGVSRPLSLELSEREFFIDNLPVRIHFIIAMIRWTGLVPWEFEFPFPGSLTSTFLNFFFSTLLLSIQVAVGP